MPCNFCSKRLSGLPHKEYPANWLGLCRKDKDQSESMDMACELVKLPWIYR